MRGYVNFIKLLIAKNARKRKWWQFRKKKTSSEKIWDIIK